MAELRAIEGITARALEFTVLCATRTGETIGVIWVSSIFAPSFGRCPLSDSNDRAIADAAIVIGEDLGELLGDAKDTVVVVDDDAEAPGGGGQNVEPGVDDASDGDLLAEVAEFDELLSGHEQGSDCDRVRWPQAVLANWSDGLPASDARLMRVVVPY